jgi:hypothetical protein
MHAMAALSVLLLPPLLWDRYAPFSQGLETKANVYLQEVARYLEEIVPPVLACFSDQDARVRYYACESMYNIAKVAKGEILLYFNEVFDALCKVGIPVFRACYCARSDTSASLPRIRSYPLRMERSCSTALSRILFPSRPLHMFRSFVVNLTLLMMNHPRKQRYNRVTRQPHFHSFDSYRF